MWKLPELKVQSLNAFKGAETEVLPVFQDSKKKAIAPKGLLGDFVKNLKAAEVFNAKLSSMQFIRFSNTETAMNSLFVGMGQTSELTAEKARQAGGHAWTKLKAEKVKTAVIHVDLFSNAETLKGFYEGLVFGVYHFVKHRSKDESADQYFGPEHLLFVTKNKSTEKRLAAELELASATVEIMNHTRDWSNEPSNIGTPEYFAKTSEKLAKEYGLKCTILNEKECAAEKMDLFLGVGIGSEREGYVVVLEYNPKGAKKNAKTVALVGKGITFDSGGISIKPSARMEEMKHDMTGAATVMGATLLAAKMKVPHKILTIMAFTENMPSGNAIQPGNVIRSRSGKTVEVINTDAEGRLILADILDYIQDRKPDYIVDAATLTGAVGVALGKMCAGLMGNDQPLMEKLKKAADATDERIWQLPLYDDYMEDLRSDTADMRNSANDSLGGTIRGAVFLKQFIRPGMKWAHLDIAYTANSISHIPYYPKKGATGAHVRMLAEFVARL